MFLDYYKLFYCFCCTAKILKELIEPVESRMSSVSHFVRDIKPSLNIKTVAIEDIYGPTTVYPDFECLVVSQETIKGGDMINAERVKKVTDIYIYRYKCFIVCIVSVAYLTFIQYNPS